MPATMRDVARKAGVSIKTVSRVVNDLGEISAPTRQRVQSVIQELGYRPNVLARGLVSGESLSIGVLLPKITDPFFPEVVLGVENVAHQHGYTVFLCNTNADPDQELAYIDLLAGKQVDGFILCATRLTEEQIVRVATQHCVSVLTGRAAVRAAVVSIPGEAGLREATSHLLRLGHRAVGYAGRAGERVAGYCAALREHGIAVVEPRMCLLPVASVEAGCQGARELLERAPELTGIVCYNDLVAIGVLQACAGLGRRLPQDIAVVGFDDIPMASLVAPKLTTMHVPRHTVGEMAMDLLLRVMAEQGGYQERLEVPVELVVRESCGAARGV